MGLKATAMRQKVTLTQSLEMTWLIHLEIKTAKIQRVIQVLKLLKKAKKLSQLIHFLIVKYRKLPLRLLHL